MPRLVGNKSNIIFSDIKQVQLVTNTKISAVPYTIDDEGKIINNIPIINAIDIDWNNAIANEITDPIKTTTDLIDLISSSKVDIKLNSQSINDIKTQIIEVKESIDNIESNNFDKLKTQLENALNEIEILQNNDENINQSIVSLSNTINDINDSIPKYSTQLKDSYNLLRRDDLEGLTSEFKGESAYDIAKRVASENGQSFPYTTESAWIVSLKGEKGNSGSSAYEIAKTTARILGNDFPYSNEQEWILALQSNDDIKEYVDEKINNTILSAGNGIVIENNTINATANTWIKL